MPDVAFRESRLGQLQFRTTGQKLLVPRCQATASRVPMIEVRQLDAEHGGLHPFHAGIESNLEMLVSARLGMIAQRTYTLRQDLIVRNDGAGFAETTEVLSRVKAEASGAPERSDAAAVIPGAMCLRGVFDQRQAPIFCQITQFRQIRRLPV